MEEKKIFVEIPGRNNDFHSAVLTTFSFDFHHFEHQVLRSLKQKWITNIAVLVDQNMLDGIVGLTSGNLKHLSQAYSVNGIKVTGAFHPKINFLIGDEKLLLFFGSGNITPGGHGKNHELFTGFYADSQDSNQLPLLLEAWNYTKHLAGDISGYSSDRIYKLIPSNCSLLNKDQISKHSFYKLEDDISVALLYNEDTSIFNQITKLVPQEEIDKITIVSPYYDEKGDALVNMIEHFNKSKLDVYLPNEFGLPPNRIKKTNRINFYAWEETERGKTKISGKNNYDRKLHSKIFHFKSKKNEYCLIGSTNATIPGLGSQAKRAINEEFCVLYKTSKHNLLKLLGIKGKKIKVSVSDLIRESSNEGLIDEDKTKKKKIYITSADMHGLQLKIFIKDSAGLIDKYLSIYDHFGSLIIKEKIKNDVKKAINLRISKSTRDKNPSFVSITDNKEGLFSNRQLINDLDKLYNTDPSKANRTVRQLVSALEVGEVNEFELLTYYNELYDHKRNIKQPKTYHDSSKLITKLGSEATSEMTYEEAKEASKDQSQYDKLVKMHNTTRLWETIYQLFSEKKDKIDDQFMDEEELGKAEISNDRDINTNNSIIKILKSKSDGDHILSSIDKLVRNYTASLNKVYTDSTHDIDTIDLAQYLLVTHIMTAVTNFTKYKLQKNHLEQKWISKLRDSYKDNMLKVLNSFSSLVIKHKLRKFPDDSYQTDRLNKYLKLTIYNSLLYSYLISPTADEDFIRVKLEIIALNFFRNFMVPDVNFEPYMLDMSKRGAESSYFNHVNVIGLKNYYLNIFNTYKEGDEFFSIDHSGICKIIEKRKDCIIFKSVFADRGSIKIKKYEKLIRNHSS